MTTGGAGMARMWSSGALAVHSSVDLRPSRVPVLILGAVLACLATLAVVALPAAIAPSSHPLVLHHGLRSDSATPMPIGLAPAASESIGASDRSFWPVPHGASLVAQGGGIHSTFSASGTSLRVAQGTLNLSLTGVVRAQRLDPVARVAPTGAANQILYYHGSLSEFYRNGPYGLEQGFIVVKPLAHTGSLVLALGISGSLRPEQIGSQILFTTSSGVTGLRYGQLDAVDATGRRLPAHLQLRKGVLQLRIDTRGARYPLRIDPFIQQGAPLGGGRVALSADSNTALIGGRTSVEVFTRSGSTWTPQGTLLTGTEIGKSVALSADGNIALVGAPADNEYAGAAFVFTRSGSTWTQEAELEGAGESGEALFGWSVALSADGNTALVGGDTGGQAWVFTRSGEAWIQGETLTGGGAGGSRSSVALSADGNTALIGGEGIDAAWVFTRSGETWTQQGEKLTGSGESYFGQSVALSSNGNTALIGASLESAAWVFTRSGETWTQGEKLTGGGEDSRFGASVTLSADGNTALIARDDNEYGGQAWIFTRSGETWIQGETLTIGKGRSGESVALSADGNTALVGDSGRNETWVFVNETFNPPEFGTCSKLVKGAGGYSGSRCTTVKEGGGYEWQAGVVQRRFTLKAGGDKFEAASGTNITCRTVTGSGEYSGPKEVSDVVVSFFGCESNGHKCTTPGLPEGDLESKTLEGVLGWEVKASKKVALDLYPNGRNGPFMEYQCVGGVPATVIGSILVPIKADEMLATTTLHYKATKGKQKPEAFEREPNDVLTASLNGEGFQQIGLSASLTQVNEEAVEINAVV